MKKKELNEADKKFIIENRLEVSMMTMSKVLQVDFYHIRKYMISENLMLTKQEVQNIRAKNLKKTIIKKTIPLEPKDKKPPVYDFWNSNINPITMYRG